MREKPRTKKISWKKRRVILLAVVLTLLLLNAAVGALAAYRTQNIQKAEMISANFHISSNYLKESSVSYNVVDWGGGFDILLYNYETENIANISAVDMTYTVTVANGSLQSVLKNDGNPAAFTTNNNIRSYSFPKSADASYHTLHIVPDGSGEVSVTVKTTAPYEKELKAKFTLIGGGLPTYTFKDRDDGTMLLTVHTNNWAEAVTVSWTANVSPDNTNEIMTAWRDSNPTGTIPAGANKSYELIFVKNTASVTSVDNFATANNAAISIG